jgi:primosomal protein N' (replication factor Y)
MVNLTVTADTEGEARDLADRASKKLLSLLENEYSDLPFVVYGPFEAAVYKVNEKYRMRLVVKCKLTSRVRKMFRGILCEFASERSASITVDLNPLTV